MAGKDGALGLFLGDFFEHRSVRIEFTTALSDLELQKKFPSIQEELAKATKEQDGLCLLGVGHGPEETVFTIQFASAKNNNIPRLKVNYQLLKVGPGIGAVVDDENALTDIVRFVWGLHMYGA